MGILFNIELIEGGILKIVLDGGKFSHEEVSEFRSAVREGVLSMGSPRLVMVDATEVTSVPSAKMRMSILNEVYKSKFDKLAIYGAPTPLKIIAKSAEAVGIVGKVAFFKNEYDARDWLVDSKQVRALN